jgi:hypothetical protein
VLLNPLTDVVYRQTTQEWPDARILSLLWCWSE